MADPLRATNTPGTAYAGQRNRTYNGIFLARNASELAGSLTQHKLAIPGLRGRHRALMTPLTMRCPADLAQK